jgi:hypothetical protein
MVGSYMRQWYEDCIQCGNLRFLDEHGRQHQPYSGPMPSEEKWEALVNEARDAQPAGSRLSGRRRRR